MAELRLGLVLVLLQTFLTAGFAASKPVESFSYESYAEVLNEYVDERSMVNYGKLKAGRQKLDTFVNTLAEFDGEVYKSWTKEQKTAFWLNAYNSLTLKVIIDNYPIKSSFLKSLTYPKNSIRQIDGVWNKITFTVMGRKVSLNDIEHEILRKEFAEPRIHMALVCAARGCPLLRNEPYIATKLDAQLDDQAGKFLLNPEKFQINFDDAVVQISPIFKWFAEDFVKSFGTEKRFRGHKNPQAAVIKFITEYVSKQVASRWGSDSRTYKISYLHYDWSLNQQ